MRLVVALALFGLALASWPLSSLVSPLPALQERGLRREGLTVIAPPVAPFDARSLLPSTPRTPLPFVPNQGQFAPAVRFQAQGGGATIAFLPDSVAMALPPAAGDAHAPVLTLHWEHARPQPQIVGLGPLPGRANFLLGNDPAAWHQNVETFGELLYSGLYQGVDLHYAGGDGALKSTYFVAPGADPARIRLRYQGAAALSLDSHGNLLIGLPRSSATSPARTLQESAPVAWQDIGGQRVFVPARYALHADGSVGFALAAYDARYRLVIDPALVFGSYLGGAGDERAEDLAVDANGDLYLVGTTSSLDFPGFGPISAGGPNVFVAKLSGDGTSLSYSTVLGGAGSDRGFGIAVNPNSGEAYLTGETDSPDFPVANAFQPGRSTGVDAFVARLNANGSLSYASYLGGNATDRAYAIAVDPASGAATIVGETNSVTPAPFNSTPPLGYKGGTDAFVARISAAPAVSYLRYLGGLNNEVARSVALDSDGNAYVVGETQSTDFGTTSGVFQPSLNNFSLDAFALKLDPSGDLVYSTFLGGSARDVAYDVAVNPSSGEAYIVGETESTNFYTTSNALQPSLQGSGFDAFALRLNAAASEVRYGTYLGGGSDDRANGVALDNQGSIYVVGETASFASFDLLFPFPTSAGGTLDPFVVKILPNGQQDYGTFLGGSGGPDSASAVAFSPADNSVFVAGWNASGQLYTAGATAPLQSSNAGGEDAFVVKLSQPLVSVGAAQVTEGSGPGTTLLSFPVTLSLTSTQALTLTYSTADGTALAGSDYTSANNVELLIPPDTRSTTLPITITRDSTYELSETFTLNILQVAGGTLAAGSASVTGTILDDDPLPELALGDLTLAEGNSGTTPFTFTVALSEISGVDAVFSYHTTDGTATASTDYLSSTQTISIPAGALTTTFTVDVLGDTLYEDDETFGVLLTPISGSSASGGALRATVTISNDDSPPTFSAGDLTLAEGNSGTTRFSFPVTLSAISGLDARLSFLTQNGTATAPSDYQSRSGTLTIPAGQLTGTVTVDVLGDTTYELTETFALSLTAQPPTLSGSASVLGTILDDDQPPVVTIGDVTQDEGNSGTTRFNFPVTLSPASGVTATLTFDTQPGGPNPATPGDDYLANAGTLSFAPGQTSATIVVSVTGDTLDELDETFVLRLVGGSGLVLGSPISGTGTIRNDDNPSISIGDANVLEGDSGSAMLSFPVSLSGATADDVRLEWSLIAGTATAGSDYLPVSGVLTFVPAGATVQTITVSVLGDRLDEPNETLSVALSNVVGARILDGTALGTILDDDESPVALDDSYSVAEDTTLTVSAASGVLANDSDGDAGEVLSATLVAAPLSGALTLNPDGSFVFTPAPDFFGLASFSYRVRDQGGNQSGLATATISVANVNDPPVAHDDSATTLEDQAVTVDVLANDGDPDGQGDLVPGSVRPTASTPVDGSLTINPLSGAITYTPAPDVNGQVAFGYQVCDRQGACATATVRITITPVNDAPIANTDVLTTPEDTALSTATATLLANDSDVEQDALSITAVAVRSSQGGVLSLVGTTVSYTPAPDFFGTDSFTYTLSDGTASSVGRVMVHVTPVNDPPTTLADQFRVEPDSSNNLLDVLANDTDPEGDTLTVRAVTQPRNGSTSLSSTGLSYTPNPGFQGVDSFSYTVSDGNGGMASATVRVTVGNHRVFLPFLTKVVAQPDLTVKLELSSGALVWSQPTLVSVIVTNHGLAPAANFWVDLYVDPASTPAVNTPWNENCAKDPCYGIAWFVGQRLEPGQSLTLTSTPDSYAPQNTRWVGFFPRRTQDVYVLVDSWNRAGNSSSADPHGALIEVDESNNLAHLSYSPMAQVASEREDPPPTQDASLPELIEPRRIP
jgi:hypothetical protein